MNSPAQAILWQIYWRARWGFAAAIAFLVLAIVLRHSLPKHWTIQMGNDTVPAVGWFLGVACLFVNMMVIVPFSMSGADAKNLTFASHMFVLPVRTNTLVAWPMACGCLTVVAVWLINTCLVLRPGITAPLWWPAAAMALFLAAFQALAWTPFAQRWLHLVVTAAVLMTPLFCLPLGIWLGVRLNDAVAAALLLSFVPLAYIAAVSGLGRTRRGQPYDWRAWDRFVEWLAKLRPAATHPFRLMSRAQLWYECRSHMIVPVFIACTMPCFLFIAAIEPNDVALGWRLMAGLLFAPLMVAGLAGGALGHLVDPSSRATQGAFVLVRPVSSLSLVKTKLVAAAILTAAIWFLFLGNISLLLLRPGFVESIARVAGSVPVWKAIACPTLVLALLILLTWTNAAENLWICLTGRKWVENVNSFGFAGLMFVGLLGGLWIGSHQELHKPALAAGPWLVSLLLMTKISVAAFVVRGLVRSQLITVSGASLMVAAWLVVVAALSVLALSLLPSEHAPATRIVPGIALFVPFARLAGAPLALEWNRHR